MITCEPWVGSYDNARHHAFRMGQGPALTGRAPIWDFVVTQRNGTQVRFHPQQTTSKVKVAYVRDGGVAPPAPPRAGSGESDGPGTYKYYKEASYPCDSGAASSANDAPASPPSTWGPHRAAHPCSSGAPLPSAPLHRRPPCDSGAPSAGPRHSSGTRGDVGPRRVGPRRKRGRDRVAMVARVVVVPRRKRGLDRVAAMARAGPHACISIHVCGAALVGSSRSRGGPSR